MIREGDVFHWRWKDEARDADLRAAVMLEHVRHKREEAERKIRSSQQDVERMAEAEAAIRAGNLDIHL